VKIRGEAREFSTGAAEVMTVIETDETCQVSPVDQEDTLKLSIIIPTKEEEPNVVPLLRRLDRALAGIESEIIFVDDSDDGTTQLLASLVKQHPDRYMLRHRYPGQRWDGLAGAVVEGLRLARGTYVIIIDADLQHPPELVPFMIVHAQSSGADVVIASRYIAGGSAEGLGSGYRRLVSHLTRWLARTLFVERLWKVHDPLGGFFLFRYKILQGVELRPIGYKILLEILMRTSWQGLQEIPYQFEKRASGTTKANLQQGLLFLRHLVRLFKDLPSAGRLWKFLAVGSSGVVVNLVIVWLLGVLLGLNRPIAWGGGLETSVISNFLLNRSITWRDRRGSGFRGLLAEGLRYHQAAYLALATNAATFWTLSWVGAPLIPVTLTAIAVGFTVNFTVCNRFVFVSRRWNPFVVQEPLFRLAVRGLKVRWRSSKL
jgi:dolichol-phosphate mannosyltransferase